MKGGKEVHRVGKGDEARGALSVNLVSVNAVGGGHKGKRGGKKSRRKYPPVTLSQQVFPSLRKSKCPPNDSSLFLAVLETFQTTTRVLKCTSSEIRIALFLLI